MYSVSTRDVQLDVAKKFAARGYFPIPIRPNSKAPQGVAWNRVAKWDDGDWAGAGGVGALCGRGVVGIDADTTFQPFLDAILWDFMDAPVRYGRKGFVIPVAVPDARGRDLVFLDPFGNRHVVQLLGAGRQFVAWGIHPDTGLPYRWDRPLPAAAGLRRFETVDGLADVIVHAAARVGLRLAKEPASDRVEPIELDATPEEMGRLRAWAEREIEKALATLASMAPGTGRGTVASALGARVGVVIRESDDWVQRAQERIREAAPDDGGNAADHSFPRGVEASSGEAAAAELARMRGVVDHAALLAAHPEAVPTAAPKEYDARLVEALTARAADLGSGRSSNVRAAERKLFGALLAVLEREGRIDADTSLRLAIDAKAFALGTQERNPLAPTPAARKLAAAVVETLGAGGDVELALALGCGVDIAPPPAPAADAAPEIPQGVYPDDEATLKFFESKMTLVRSGASHGWYVRERTGVVIVADKDMLTRFGGRYVRIGDGKVPIMNYMRDKSPAKLAVFKAAGETVADDEYNLWRGFAYAPREGTDRIRPFLRHLWQVVCKRDRTEFRYLLRWMAWGVQNPGKPCPVAVVLKSPREGTGKSLVSDALRKLYGAHGLLVSDPDQFVGAYTDHLETACFVSLDEALFAGNRAQADRVKSRLTANEITVHRKFMSAYSAPNRMQAMLTTNHAHAVDAGDGARRWCVLEVSEDHAGDAAWFDPIWGGLEGDGGAGYAQLLGFLQRVRLGDWSPRNPPVTAGTQEEKIMSNPIALWLHACCEQWGVPYESETGHKTMLDLGRNWHSVTLYRAFLLWHGESRRGDRPMSYIEFSRANAKFLDDVDRITETAGGKRLNGRFVPDADELERRLRANA